MMVEARRSFCGQSPRRALIRSFPISEPVLTPALIHLENHLYLHRGVQGQGAHAHAERAWRPFSPRTSTKRSEQPLITRGWSPNSGRQLTIPKTLTVCLICPGCPVPAGPRPKETSRSNGRPRKPAPGRHPPPPCLWKRFRLHAWAPCRTSRADFRSAPRET